ncbi:hypothetical protein ACTI_06820 [Actinoplanes sp. OR16]|nr:hypothetical protein ACTI_06820 [Actinoplanes sp. OR16]
MAEEYEEERAAGPHDPGAGEDWAGADVPDPWEEGADGLDPGSVPEESA